MGEMFAVFIGDTIQSVHMRRREARHKANYYTDTMKLKGARVEKLIWEVIPRRSNGGV